MKKRTVEELMVPLSEYATISENASLSDAIAALERSQNRFDPSRYRHRAILVLDEGGKVVGILRLTDIFTDVVDAIKACDL